MTKSTIFVLLGVSGAHLLAAAGEIATNDWVGGIVHLASSGSFGAMVWYLVCKRLPEIEARHRAEREADRELQRATIDALGDVKEQLVRIVEHVRSEDR